LGCEYERERERERIISPSEREIKEKVKKMEFPILPGTMLMVGIISYLWQSCQANILSLTSYAKTDQEPWPAYYHLFPYMLPGLDSG
jgi:hypothetical protein